MAPTPQSSPSLKIRIDLDAEDRIGPGKIRLLEAIDTCGSISAAGRMMNMSYKHAWDLVDEIARICKHDVIISRVGSNKGGGAELTPFGLALVARYAIIKVADFLAATSQLAQTTLRSVLGKHELDELLAERDRLNADIQEILDQQTDAWGIKVTNVEIKHVDLNENMIRAIAKQAEAERLRRAKVINAEGEQQAAEKLVEAGRLLAREPQAMQLRYFAALHDTASERSSTIVFPLPTDLLTHLAPRPEGAE